MRSVIHAANRIVVKVGSSLVTNDGKGLDLAALARWAAEIAELKRRGKQVVLVSSGAIAEGCQRLGWSVRPKGVRIAGSRCRRPDGPVSGYETAFRSLA
jgi:glutamate 5-kinase